ncbi:MAG TPA: nitrous oxide reductase accessory protein NosL [Thermodesulfobacteriota bacterium]|nr:nitrous oxide reductase accessory protein NosL [Thermodesulfobacteriota bacterium]
MKILLILLVVLSFTACRDNIDTGPHVIHYGEDVCERCKMIISDKRFAAELVDQKGEALMFDDVGCMADYMKGSEKEGAKPLAMYVTDFSTGEWIDAGKAFYLLNPELKSPMGYNIAAFGSSEAMKGSPFREGGKEAGGFGDLVK